MDRRGSDRGGGAAGVSGGGGIDRDTLFTAALIGVRLVILVLFLAEIRRGNFGGPDVVRFRALAHLGATPWRDYQVEYAPLEFILIKGLFGVGILAAATRLALLALAADLAIWAGVRAGWGPRAGRYYLAIGLPVVILALQRIDLVVVALAVWAFVLLRRSRPVGAGATLGLAVLMKVWPLILLPGMWIVGRAKSAWSLVAVLSAGVGAWILWAGTGGPGQVLGFRGATGWEAGSTVGTLVWVFGGGPVRSEAGAARVGTAPVWAKVVLALVLISTLFCLWRRASRLGTEVAGGPAVSSIAALLLLSPLFSTQYILWLLPWAAISALDEDHPTLPLAGVFVAASATAVIAMYLYGGPHDAAVKGASLVRIVVLAALVVRGLARGGRAAGESPPANGGLVAG